MTQQQIDRLNNNGFIQTHLPPPPPRRPFVWADVILQAVAIVFLLTLTVYLCQAAITWVGAY